MKIKSLKLTALLPALLLGMSPLAAQVKTVYIVKDLGTLGGNSSDARGINDKGEIVGVAKNAAGQDRAFLYVDGVMKDLGTLGGTTSFALAINSLGDIVGAAKNGAGQTHATAFNRGSAASNAAIDPQYYFDSQATCNSARGAGEAAGFGIDFLSPDPMRAFRKQGFAPMTSVAMANLGGNESRAFGMNESGFIVGSSRIAGNGAQKAFFYNHQSTVALPTLGGTNAEARDINNSDRIVGWSDIASGGQRAFLYFNGGIVSLGSLGGNSFAHAINDAGDIVGISDTAGPGSGAAFLYRNGTMINLNSQLPADSGWNLIFANAINERGQIVGHGTFKGQSRAFLLSPDQEAPVVTPKVTSPSTSRPSLTIKGTATDDGKIKIVQYQIGRGPFLKATGTTEWSFKAQLQPGRNVIKIRARDAAGNISRARRVVVTRS